jgi:hypothetical protein
MSKKRKIEERTVKKIPTNADVVNSINAAFRQAVKNPLITSNPKDILMAYIDKKNCAIEYKSGLYDKIENLCGKIAFLQGCKKMGLNPLDAAQVVIIRGIQTTVDRIGLERAISISDLTTDHLSNKFFEWGDIVDAKFATPIHPITNEQISQLPEKIKKLMDAL